MVVKNSLLRKYFQKQKYFDCLDTLLKIKMNKKYSLTLVLRKMQAETTKEKKSIFLTSKYMYFSCLLSKIVSFLKFILCIL